MTLRPTIAGSPANIRCQAPWLITTTLDGKTVYSRGRTAAPARVGRQARRRILLRDSSANDGLRLGAVEVVEALRACRRNMAEGLRSVVPIEKRAGRNPFTVLGMIALREPQRHDPLGVSIRQFPKKQGVDDGETATVPPMPIARTTTASVEISGRRLSMRMA